MSDQEVTVNFKVADKPPDEQFTKNAGNLYDTNLCAKDTSCRSLTVTEHGDMTRYCQKPVDPGYSNGFDVSTDDASPMHRRTDLSLDTGPMDSPYIAIPLNCSVETDKESNLNDSDTMITPCPNVTSPNVTFTELTPVKVARPFQTVPLDFSGTGNIYAMETENIVSIATTEPVSITDIVASGNVISIAMAEPVSITDVIATANGISIATAEPISITTLDGFSSSNPVLSQELNTRDVNSNVVPKRLHVAEHYDAVSRLNRQPNNVTNVISEKRLNTYTGKGPLENSAEAVYCSAAKHVPSQFGQQIRKTEEKPVKRKRNRRKLDPDEPPLAPPVTVLPPCAVCGSKSSGFHYGANTCEACKGFFRRTLKKNEVKFQCSCTEEEREERRQDDGVGKNTCPACRYQQCLAVGMSRNAIKIGRYTLQRKTKNICYVKTLEGNEENRNGENSPESSSASYSSKSPSTNVTSPSIDISSPSGNSSSGSVISLPNSPADVETASPIGPSKYVPPAKKIKLSGDITLPEVDTYVKTLYHAFKCLLEEAPVLQKEKLRRDQQQYLEQYTLKREMFGLNKPITKEEYFELYNSTGLELDNRKEHVIEAVKYFEDKISKLVEFAKCIPGFRDLTLQDQANLIKIARIDCGLLSDHSLKFLNPDDGITTTPWGTHMHLDEVENIVNKEFIMGKYRLKKQVQGLDLSAEEEAILAGIILTFTASRIDCTILSGHSDIFLNADDSITTTPWGKHMHLDEIQNIVKKEFILDKYRLKQMIKSFELSAEEEAVLSGVILTFTDRCELSEPEKVQAIQHKLLACLQYLIEIRPNSKPNKLGRIFNFLIAVRNVSEWEAELIKEISLDFPSVVSIEKMESTLFTNLGDNYGEESQ